MIDALLIAAIIWCESGSLGNEATSAAGAKGLMQIMDPTFNEWAGKLKIEKPNIRNPIHNIAVGSAYIAHLVKRYNGDIQMALTAYNWGMGNVASAMRKAQSTKWEDLLPFMPKETKEYSPKVLSKYNLMKSSVV